MQSETTWKPLAPDLNSVLSHSREPLRVLADLETPAIVLRHAYDSAQIQPLIQRFIRMGLMRDPLAPTNLDRADKRLRIDIGTSLGNRGHDRDAFFSHAAETHRLFTFLFEGFDNPVAVIYDALTSLAVGKSVKTAQEPDGHRYGPAIFRIHYEGQFYRPHIDHVVLREKRTGYSVYRFTHQFAGVLCLQNSAKDGRSPQGILHRCAWQPKLQPHLEGSTFHEYAIENHIEHFRVDLKPGDLYFFNSGCVHEVPLVEGDQPRIVLAVFIGFSKDEEEVFVWS